MKKALFFIFFILLALPMVVSAEEDLCSYGHGCWFSVYSDGELVVAGPSVDDQIGFNCSATSFDLGLYGLDHERVVGFEIWDGICDGGAIITITAGGNQFRFHTGVQGDLDIPIEPVCNGWQNEGRTFYLFSSPMKPMCDQG